MKKIKFIYFGSSDFSRMILDGLCKKGYLPSLIITKPDKPKGRGLKIQPTEVSSFAQERKLTCIKPALLSDSALKKELSKIEADFFIIADYGKIIPSFLLSLPKVFSLCVHPSLLPFYRGPAPIETAILNSEVETGVTIFKVNEEVDAGDVILQRNVTIDYLDDFFLLQEKLAKAGVFLLIESLKKIISNDYVLIPQDEKKASLTKKLKKEDGRISWKSSAKVIRDLIRATLGWPSAYTYYKGIMLKVLAADVIEEKTQALTATIIKVDKKGIYVATGNGILKINELQPQGKRKMDAWAFVCGCKMKEGDRLLEK